MAKTSTIEVGQSYREPGRSIALLWVVEALFTGQDGRQYARLRRADDRSAQKTLALTALADRDRYQLAQPAVKEA